MGAGGRLSTDPRRAVCRRGQSHPAELYAPAVRGEIWRQLDDIEWLNSLPEGLPEDRGIPGRMKRVLMYQCSTCHNSAFVLEKRFTAADRELLYDYMTLDSHRVDPPYDPSPFYFFRVSRRRQSRLSPDGGTPLRAVIAHAAYGAPCAARLEEL